MKPDTEALADVVIKVCQQMGCKVDMSDLFLIIRNANEKAKRLGKEDNVSEILDVDLRDFIYRRRRLGRKENVQCVVNVAEIPA